MKVVVDTNVLVSGLLSQEGPPGQIVDMIGSGKLEVCHNSKILVEYREVLMRPEFNLSEPLVASPLDQIRTRGESVNSQPLPRPLLDASDEAFLEAALSGEVECLITGNLKHFPPSHRHEVRVLSPREFLEFYRDQRDGPGKVKSPSAEYRSRSFKKRKRSRS